MSAHKEIKNFLKSFGLEYIRRTYDTSNVYIFKHGDKKIRFRQLQFGFCDLTFKLSMKNELDILLRINFDKCGNIEIYIPENGKYQFVLKNSYDELDFYVTKILKVTHSDVENSEWYKTLIMLFDIFSIDSYHNVNVKSARN